MAGTGLASGIEDFSGNTNTSFPQVQTWPQYQSCAHNDISKLVEALTLAQADFSPLLKDTENPYFKSKYSDLAAVIKATLPALNKHGLTVIQLTSTDFVNKAAIVTTILAHKSGQQISSTLSVPTGAKFDAQSLGSALTYGKRYSYQAIVGVAADVDDDGNSIATGFDEAPSKPKYEPKPGKTGITHNKSGFVAAPKSTVDDPIYTMKNDKTGAWEKVTQKEFITGKSPESGQVPKATIPPPPKMQGDIGVLPKLNLNTNAGFASQADHEPTKEEKDDFKKKARLYVQILLPEAGVENPAETLKNFVEKLTGVSDTKKLSFSQWTATMEALDNAVITGKLKAVVEG